MRNKPKYHLHIIRTVLCCIRLQTSPLKTKTTFFFQRLRLFYGENKYGGFFGLICIILKQSKDDVVVGLVETIAPPHVERVLHRVGLQVTRLPTVILTHSPIHPHLDVLQRHLGPLTHVSLFSFHFLESTQSLLVEHFLLCSVFTVLNWSLIVGGSSNHRLSDVLTVKKRKLIANWP